MLFFKKIFKFFYWKFWDIRNKPPARPYGIYLYIGIPGQGKTISMTEHIFRLKKQFPKAKVFTNYGLNIQDGEITSVWDLIELDNGSDGIIFGFDEVQNTFSSRFWQNFPPEMIALLTQNRKKAKMFLCTTQHFQSIEVNFRRICNYVIECRNFAGRWFFQRAFLVESYKESDTETKLRRRAWRYSFVADNDLFNSFDTYKVIDKLVDLNRLEHNIKKKTRA